MTLRPRAVIVWRRSERQELVARHGTLAQAKFLMAMRAQPLDVVATADRHQEAALDTVAGAVPSDWRRAEVEREDLARFVFGPEDVVVVVGRDGLVANVAKYLDGQPVVGIDGDPGRNPGVLVPHRPGAAAGALRAAATGAATVELRTMVEATTDDGGSLRALNEIYVGHRTHQSARYRIAAPGGRGEHQSSSGVLAGTGTGATGWLRSVWQERRSGLPLPRPEDPDVCWFVREAWPSPATGTDHTEGVLHADEALTIVTESDELVCFGDGIESDTLGLSFGQRLEVRRADQHLHLVI